jgi:hypothetical protein
LFVLWSSFCKDSTLGGGQLYLAGGVSKHAQKKRLDQMGQAAQKEALVDKKLQKTHFKFFYQSLYPKPVFY